MHNGYIDAQDLPIKFRYAHILPGLKHLLLSIVQLCNARCKVISTANDVSIRYKGEIILQESKCTRTGL